MNVDTGPKQIAPVSSIPDEINTRETEPWISSKFEFT